MSVGPAMPANLRGPGLSRVHRFDLVLVMLRDDLAFDVELQGQLAALLGEICRQQGEVLDRLPASEVRIDVVHGLLKVRSQAGLVEAKLGSGGPVRDDQ